MKQPINRHAPVFLPWPDKIYDKIYKESVARPTLIGIHKTNWLARPLARPMPILEPGGLLERAKHMANHA